jgi:chromosome partitioning protein
MDNEQVRIIAVANEKGGVGKTVTVLNLGAALCMQGKKVLIVDMDPQFNATRGLGIEVTDDMPNIYKLLKGEEPLRSADIIVKTRWQGLDLIPSHVDLAGAEVELVDEVGRENKLRYALDDINSSYDFILLDTPPSLSLLTVNVLAYAKEVLVPCQTHPYAYAALDELFDTIGAVKRNMNEDLEIIGILATLFDTRTRVSHNILEQLKNNERYGPLLFATVIRVNTTIAESAGVNKPVVFYRQGSYGAMDYMDLAKELLSQQ